MKKSLINKLKMIETLLMVLQGRISIWTSSLPFTTAVGELTLQKQQIEEQVKRHEILKKPSAEAKNNQKTLSIDLSLPLCGATSAYATDTHNTELWQKVDYSENELKKGSELVFAQRMLGINEIIEPLLEQLIPYGITKAMLDEQHSAVELFITMLPNSREKQKLLKSLGDRMEATFDQAMDLLYRRLDKLMLIYKKSYPDFYTEYMNARIIGGWGKNGEEEKDEGEEDEGGEKTEG